MFYNAKSFNQNLCSWKDNGNANFDRFCEGAFSCGGCTFTNKPTAAPTRKPRYGKVRYGRRLVTSSFWERDEVALCLSDEYDLLLYTNGHLVIVSAPSDPTSQCPIFAIDAGYAVLPQTENKDDEEFQAVSSAPEVDIKTLAKYFTVVHRDDFGSFDTLDLGYKMPLRKFYLAVENARTSVKTEEDYDIIDNNCAIFILDVLAYLKLPYKETNMKRSLVNYVADGLIENEEVKNKILDSVSKQGATAGVWRHLRSDNAIIEHVVGSFIEKHHLD
jgi:hypothetical protein